jgi:hypothetical protein
LQFKKGSKEQDYLQVLAQLKPQDILAEFVFKDRLFSSLSNHAFVQGQQDGTQQTWSEVEERARQNIQSVDRIVESGLQEVYDQFECETMGKVCARLMLSLSNSTGRHQSYEASW